MVNVLKKLTSCAKKLHHSSMFDCVLNTPLTRKVMRMWGISRLWHSVKSVCIRNYSGSYFPAFGLNTEKHAVSLCIQSECRNIRTGMALLTLCKCKEFSTRSWFSGSIKLWEVFLWWLRNLACSNSAGNDVVKKTGFVCLLDSFCKHRQEGVMMLRELMCVERYFWANGGCIMSWCGKLTYGEYGFNLQLWTHLASSIFK